MNRKSFISLALALALTASWPTVSHGQSACYVDYKASKQSSSGLRLHYGVMRVSSCSGTGAAAGEVRARLSARGWQLLTVISQFGEGGLNQRRGNAGGYFLRF